MPYKDPKEQAAYMQQHRRDKAENYAAAQKRWKMRKKRHATIALKAWLMEDENGSVGNLPSPSQRRLHVDGGKFRNGLGTDRR